MTPSHVLAINHEKEYMKDRIQIHATPYRQFPLRLQHELADELDRVADDMQITKTRITQIAIRKFLLELNASGTRQHIKELCAV